jgi:ribose transport system substrate-binding protein
VNATPSGTPDPATMKSLVTDYLTAHPNEHHIAIGCFNDDGGNAAYSAAKASNRLNDVMIVSHNADKVALDVLREGDSAWVGTVNYNSDKYGDQIVDMALKILSGAKVDNQVYAYTNIVNADNVNELFPK